MKRKSAMKLMASVAVVAVGIYVGAFMTTEAEGDTIVPGSIDDPVVTKSYVDQKLGSQSGGMTAEDVQKLITEQLSANSSEVVVVTVPLGKTLIAKDGSEFVVRAGKAVAYSSDANGISDLTDGKDITNGKSVPNNHLILFPRGGRGVQPDPAQKNGLTVLVRGQYQLQ